MDKEKLIGRRAETESGMPEDTVPVPGLGEVRVRGLNRAEAMIVQRAKGTEATERVILSLGMVDPTLTEAEAGQWQQNGVAGEIEPVSRRIAELSGMVEGAPKSGLQSDGGRPES